MTVNTNGNVPTDDSTAHRVLDMWTLRGMPHPDHARAVTAVRELFPPLAAALDGLCDARKVARP